MAETGMLPTNSQIEMWRRRKVELEQELVDKQRELNGITKLLDAVSMLMPHGARPSMEVPPKTNGANHMAEPKEAMTDAIPRLVEAHGKPMSKAILKERLLESGFSRERLGNYFYTVIMRLKERGKIDVAKDGSLTLGMMS